MATRLRKTRKFRGSRTHGWGQVGQHRSTGHKGGHGQAGQLKHHFSSMLKYDPNHFGHDSTNPPTRVVIKKWINIRDLDALYIKFGKIIDNKQILDLTSMGYEKLLGGGNVTQQYDIKIANFTKLAETKIKKLQGSIIQ